MTPSPATPTEETRVTDFDVLTADGKVLWDRFAPKDISETVSVYAICALVRNAVLAALPRGEVSEAVRKALAVILDYANGSKWAALSDAVGVAPYAEHLSPRQNTLRVIDAMFALGLSRGGGDGEAVRKAKHEALQECAEAWRGHWSDGSRLPADTAFDFIRNQASRYAPAPVVRSVTVGGVRIRYEGGVWHADCDWPNVTAQHRTTHNAHLHNVLREYELWPTDAELRELLALPVEASDAAR
jgi:hypothetical protein